MKRLILLLLLTISLFSCKVTKVNMIPKREILTRIDFREYSKKDFLFTPEKYDGKYESVGLISFLIMPEAVKEKIKVNPFVDSEETYKWNINEINIQNAVEGIYKHCIEMGADALVNFKADVEIEDNSIATPPLKLYGYRITGFAIKRK